MNRKLLKQYDEYLVSRLHDIENYKMPVICNNNLIRSISLEPSLMTQLIALIRCIESAKSSIKIYFCDSQHYFFDHPIFLNSLEFEALNGIKIDIISNSFYKETDKCYYKLCKLHNFNLYINDYTINISEWISSNYDKHFLSKHMLYNGIFFCIDNLIYGILDKDYNILIYKNDAFSFFKNQNKHIFDTK